MSVQCATALGRVIYVDANTPDNNDGSSWAKAYKYLQDSLVDANSSGDVNEIHVAQGIYKPDEDSNNPDGTGDRSATFQLISGVSFKGGYAGYGAPDPNARDIEQYETVLSGDIDGNDTLGLDPCDLLDDPNRCENSYHVVTGSGTDETAVLDGLTIIAGNANSPDFPHNRGGGMYNYQGHSTVNNCTFRANSAVSGGGMYNRVSSPTVTNCTFSGNAARDYGAGILNYESSSPILNICTFTTNSTDLGGGMCNYGNSHATLITCTFSANRALSGGGILNQFESSSKLTNCTFSNNITEYGGGGIANQGDSNSILMNCSFRGNQVRTSYGGGGILNWNSSAMVTNCTFSDNSADYGRGIYNYDSNSTLLNCILWSNTASDGNEIALYNSSTIDVNYCDVKGGQSDIYNDGSSSVSWGSGNINVNPYFVDPNGPDDIIGTEDDNLRLSHDSDCIDAGNNAELPQDTDDLDGDGNTVEPIPWDLDGRARSVDGDGNSTKIVDIGAYEFSFSYIGDFDGQFDVDFADFAFLGLTWMKEQGQSGYNPNCDISIPADNLIDEKDLGVLSRNWLAGK